MLRFELGRLLLVLEYTRALIHAQFSLGWRCLLTSIDENDDGSSAWAVVRWLLPLGACSRLSEPEEEVPEGCALRKDICSSERERDTKHTHTLEPQSKMGGLLRTLTSLATARSAAKSKGPFAFRGAFSGCHTHTKSYTVL